MNDRVDHGVESCREWYSERGIDNEFSELKAYLRSGLSVLDVGCGPGTITMDVARIVSPGLVSGIDVATASVNEATESSRKAGVRNVRYEVADAVELPFANDSFDVVYSTNVLSFIQDPVRALLEQKRVTRRGGWVIAQADDRVASIFYPLCPNAERFFASLSAVSDPLKDCFIVDCALGRKLYARFVEAGFRETQVVPTHPYHSWIYAGSSQIGTFLSFDRSGPWAPVYTRLLSVGAIDEETLDKADRELELWRKHPHAFYLCPSVMVAGRIR